ncbi:hypothetical protein PoB_002699200 [Plakobranchus ocellatus]|uniref:Uncharacterized protein n=1 Tax=Plakobranchus ocellatus TaxID=259542 RepID=A0AAV3ZZM7_9GAST|nr:hypothetical protein PoB_002699200 [Plakobranchus ocellatus]
MQLAFKKGCYGTVDSEFVLRSAETLLSRIRALPLVPWPDGGPESLRSRCLGQDVHKSDENPSLSFCQGTKNEEEGGKGRGGGGGGVKRTIQAGCWENGYGRQQDGKNY